MGFERTWLIRHAESSWNAAGRWQGQLDPPLSARGLQQAEKLARELAGEGLEILVSSDLVRCAATAAAVGETLGLEPLVEPRLRELDAGDWAGRTRTEIAARSAAALAHFDSGAVDAPAGLAECRHDVARRARAALRELAARHAGLHLAVLTHSGVIQSLLPELVLGNAEWAVVESARLLDVGEAAA